MKAFSLLLSLIIISCGTTKTVQKTTPPATDNGYSFAFKYKANTDLRTHIEMVMKNETTIEGMGDSTTMVNSVKTNMITRTNFGEETSGTIPLVIVYEDYKLISEPLPAKDLDIPDYTNVVVYGTVINNKITLDSLSNIEPPYDEPLKQGLLSGFKNSAVDFPDRKLVINDSFTLYQPLDIPLPEGSTNDVILTITYILSEITGHDALFDISYSADGNISAGGIKAPIQSVGTGSMTYDMKEGYVRTNTVDDLSISSMEMNGLKIKTKINTTSKIENTKL